MQLHKLFLSSLAGKVLTALTGLGLLAFIVVHLMGNLTLFRPTGDAFNHYAYLLQNVQLGLLVAEGGLLLLLILHASVASVIQWKDWRARPTAYKMWRSKRTVPYSNVSSRTMIVTGLLIATFAILHVLQFRFGPGVEQGYAVVADGVVMRDLYRLVIETFQNPWFLAFYAGSVIVLGFHLRHAMWSGFQSLGLMPPRHSRVIYWMTLLLAVVIAGGFLLMPAWVYFNLAEVIR